MLEEQLNKDLLRRSSVRFRYSLQHKLQYSLGRFFDMLEKYFVAKDNKKVNKSVWRMPRLPEAKKDVISCDKSRGGANNYRSVNFRMG